MGQYGIEYWMSNIDSGVTNITVVLEGGTRDIVGGSVYAKFCGFDTATYNDNTGQFDLTTIPCGCAFDLNAGKATASL